MQNSPEIFPAKPSGDPGPAAVVVPQFARRRFSGPAMRCNVLHEIFENRADVRPATIAVVCGREETTYGELEARANRIAHHLRRRGVRRGSCVALLLSRSADAYAALLGILKAGAAYVPLDPEYPAERVAGILKDSAAAVLITTTELARAQTAYTGQIVRVDADRAALDAESAMRLSPNAVGVGPRDLCYIIYTSGSTGRPKGVMIEHRSACHLVATEGRLFAVRPEDRVYQGFSLSFDASVEEVWLAFRAGATLVAATPEMTRAGPDLARLLTDAGVTVLSCVPTLLAMIGEGKDVPTLRLLILGGEACPPHLVARWSRPGRRMVNTYGPTEATVIATCADLSPDRPVTIGRAIPGYRVHLLDKARQPVAPGVIGEIWIGGIGVARGYVGLPGETAARFQADPFAPAEESGARLYRTGDLGRRDEQGNIEFHGRADAQVKIRGFRVELAEIESALLKHPGVRAAACALHTDGAGVRQLTGYVVRRDGRPLDGDGLRAQLRDRLPAYMIPAVIETLADLPRLPSGKLDRAALPAPGKRTVAPQTKGRPPRTKTERRLAQVWQDLLHVQAVSADDHFFHDLGGDSLLAALVVSELRNDPRHAAVGMAAVYDHPTIARLAAALDASRPASAPPPVPVTVRTDRHLPGRHFRGGVLQTLGLYFVFGFRALQWITPYLVYFMLLAAEQPVTVAVGWAVASALAALPVLLLLAVAAKWLLLGRIRPGRHPLWGAYHLRWWFVQGLVTSLHLNHLCGTPLLPFVYRLLGARIGRDVQLETDDLAAYDLISIGDGSSIDDKASVFGSTVADGELVIGPVRIGRHCFVGARSVVREHTVMGDGARLEDLSLLPAGGAIPAGETWAGSAARFLAASVPVAPPPAPGPVRRAATLGLYAVLALILPLLPLAAFAPGVAFLSRIDALAQPWLFLAAAPLVGGSFVLLLTSGTTLLKWLLLGRARAGTHPVHGGYYVRKWIVDRLLAQSLDVAGSLHATLYLPPWYRALGAKLGRSVELSTATAMTPDLLEIGDGGTVADEVSLSAARVEGGWLTLAPTRIGRRAFVGNGAVVPPGTELGAGSLIGVLSVPPVARGAAAAANSSWLGSPAIWLPRRQPSAAFPEQRTFCPSRRLWLTRAAIEILRVTLPPAGFILVTTTVVIAAIELWDRTGLATALLLLPLVYAACCAAVAFGVVAVKWAVMGRYRPFQHPLWSTFVWRLEFVNALYEFLVTPLALEALQATPLLPWYLRLLGARIGRRTYVHTTGFLEWDLVEVGDEAVLNEDCVLQTHLFEDRVLKAARLRVGRGCELGAGSVVLYDSEMGDGSRLDALSLLMKGERLPPGTAWAGSPASSAQGRPAAAAAAA